MIRLQSVSFTLPSQNYSKPVSERQRGIFSVKGLARLAGYLYEDAEHLEPTPSFRYKEIKDSIDHE